MEPGWIALIVIVSLLGALALARWVVVPLISPRPANLGVTDGRFNLTCGRWRNCYSTQHPDRDDPYRAADPIPLEEALAAARDHAIEAIKAMARTKIVTAAPDYVHAEFKSLTWGFVDDVELYIDADAGVIHYRSASRLSGSDHGMNKKRMTEFQERYEKLARA